MGLRTTIEANMNPEYAAFLATKAVRAKERGLTKIPDLAPHLFPFQRMCVEANLRIGSGALFHDTGLGKQQPINEPVLTPSGWTVMGALSPGDLVIGSNGRPTVVLGVFPQGIKPVWRVELSDGSFVRAGMDHLWSVRTKVDRYRGNQFRAMTTLEIAESIHRDWQLPMISPMFDHDISLPVDPYTLGVALGDGTFGDTASLCTDDWIGAKVGWHRTQNHKTCDYVGYWFAPLEFTRAIKELGLHRKTSADKFVPMAYLHASPAQRLALLIGLMDTDGYPIPGGGAEFSSTSQQLIDAVISLCRSLGGVARGPRRAVATFDYKGEKRQGKEAWRVNIKLPTGLPLFLLPRKALEYVEPTKYSPVRIIRNIVDEGVDEPQVCIKVAAQDSLYVTRDYVLTHNTECQLEWCQRVIEATNKPALILTPLAVAGQTRRRAERWGYAARVIREQSEVIGLPCINICNYDRLDRLDASAFGAVALDESSVLKSFTGKTTRALIEMWRGARFKLCATATPAPNDHMELGNYSEFLDIMHANEMLSRFFINDASTASQEWRLKRHAETAFWNWMASWAMMAEKPSDITAHAADDERFVLPPMQVIRHRARDSKIDREFADMFGAPALSATNIHRIKRQTSEARAECAAAVVNSESDRSWVIWVDTDYEGDAARHAIPSAVEIRGSQSTAEKEEKLAGFADGSIMHLIGKPSMIGFGLDWSHCARMAFIGRSYSYETWYQAVRRCWRFGQKERVDVHLIVAEGESEIGRIIDRKSSDHTKMKRAMRLAMARGDGASEAVKEIYNPQNTVRSASWLR